jgi:hypothetical protein
LIRYLVNLLFGYYAKLKLWDEFYLQLLENERLPYLNKRKKENIKSKKFNEWIFSNEDKKNIHCCLYFVVTYVFNIFNKYLFFKITFIFTRLDKIIF